MVTARTKITENVDLLLVSNCDVIAHIGHHQRNVCVAATNSVAIYDKSSARWTEGPKMRSARAECGAAAMMGVKIYVAGNETKIFIIYSRNYACACIKAEPISAV